MQAVFNVYSGESYEILNEEINNLQEGEIPLRRLPRSSCRKCYGRGHIGKDKIKHIYQPCPLCVEKQIIDGGEKFLYFNYIAFRNK